VAVGGAGVVGRERLAERRGEEKWPPHREWTSGILARLCDPPGTRHFLLPE